MYVNKIVCILVATLSLKLYIMRVEMIGTIPKLINGPGTTQSC